MHKHNHRNLNSSQPRKKEKKNYNSKKQIQHFGVVSVLKSKSENRAKLLLEMCNWLYYIILCYCTGRHRHAKLHVLYICPLVAVNQILDRKQFLTFRKILEFLKVSRTE